MTSSRPPVPTIILGTHMASWAAWSHNKYNPAQQLPRALFYSVFRWMDRQTFPKLPEDREIYEDSGGYTALTQHGGYPFTPRQYLDLRRRQRDAWGPALKWGAGMDWMCEPEARHRTCLTVAEHQLRTVQNWEELCSLAAGTDHIIPVVTGYHLHEYADCVELYEKRGHDLRREPIVGVGTLCRRQSTNEVEQIVSMLHDHGLKLHAFGVSTPGLLRIWRYVVSTDSTAWSKVAREKRLLLPECARDHRLTHGNCANCPTWALNWHATRVDLVHRLAAGEEAAVSDEEGELARTRPKRRTAVSKTVISDTDELRSALARSRARLTALAHQLARAQGTIRTLQRRLRVAQCRVRRPRGRPAKATPVEVLAQYLQAATWVATHQPTAAIKAKRAEAVQRAAARLAIAEVSVYRHLRTARSAADYSWTGPDWAAP